MTVDYKLEPSDFLAFEEGRRRFFSPDSLSQGYYFLVVPALGVGLALAVESFTVAAIFTVLFMASGWSIQHHAQQLYRRSVSADTNMACMRQWRAALTVDGISISSESVDTLYRWPFVREVLLDTRYIYFVITPLQKIHIPVRAFDDKEHLQKFVVCARSYVKHPIG
jgi:hypothetical protein